CEHWPGCTAGNPFPQKDYHAFIEFGNRVVGAGTIALTLVAWLATRRTPGLPRWSRRLAAAVFVGALAQAPLGLLTVRVHLHPLAVMTHLLLSIAVLGGAVVVALEARGLERGHVPPLVPRELQKLSLAFVAACFVLVVSGTFATAAGPHSGGDHVRRYGTLSTSLIVHAAAVAVFGCTLLFSLGYLAARRERSPRLFALGLGVAGVTILQMGLGELQYRTHLPWWLVLVHVALAAGVWGATVALATLFRRPLASFRPG
ncbi:MAG: COX15/CtaA family protein, partial [Gaiellaceae bacterium]